MKYLFTLTLLGSYLTESSAIFESFSSIKMFSSVDTIFLILYDLSFSLFFKQKFIGIKRKRKIF